MSFFDKIREGLKKTKQSAQNNVNAVLATFRTVDEDLLSELEDSLILADIGAETAMTTEDTPDHPLFAVNQFSSSGSAFHTM